MKREVPSGLEESSDTIGDLGLPEEPALRPEEAAEAVREARRMVERCRPPEPEAVEVPSGPMPPDEKTS